MAAMFCITLNLTSNEWLRVKQAADAQWPGERMSTGELCRRYVLAGVDGLKNVPEADRARVQRQYQATMEAGEERWRH
jgi:hypothetical protein